MPAREEFEKLFREFGNGEVSEKSIGTDIIFKTVSVAGGMMILKLPSTGDGFCSLELWSTEKLDLSRNGGSGGAALFLTAKRGTSDAVKVSTSFEVESSVASLVGAIIKRIAELHGRAGYDTLPTGKNVRT
jgi:hypothetical protein